MKIDIEPTIEIASGLDKLRLQTKELDALYFVRLANGSEFTVKWDKDGLKSFQPNKTISEMMKQWEEGIIRTIETNKKAAETGEHPTWTQPIYENVEYNGRVICKKVIGKKPYSLCNSSIENFKMFVERDMKKLGKMEFVKLV
jgi:hypothetical protein